MRASGTRRSYDAPYELPRTWPLSPGKPGRLAGSTLAFEVEHPDVGSPGPAYLGAPFVPVHSRRLHRVQATLQKPAAHIVDVKIHASRCGKAIHDPDRSTRRVG